VKGGSQTSLAREGGAQIYLGDEGGVHFILLKWEGLNLQQVERPFGVNKGKQIGTIFKNHYSFEESVFIIACLSPADELD